MTDETGTAAGQLRSYVERIEKLEEEKKTLSEDIKGVYAEAKGNGFDTKALKQVIRLRAMDPDVRKELESIVELYESRLGE